MENIVKDLLDFIERVRFDSNGIEVQELSCSRIKKFLKGDISSLQKRIDKTKKRIEETSGMLFNEQQSSLFFLQGEGLRWNRLETQTNEGLVSGGFCINGVMDMFLDPVNFFEKSQHKLFSNAHTGIATITENMRWFESKTAHNAPESTPQYGCFLFEPPNFPSKYYFYDSGLLFQLPFKNFEEYLTAMMNSAAVSGWQYFYISPLEVIQKNIGQPYITWPQHISSCLDGRMQSVIYNQSIEYDRLDLIYEHIERCVQLLPETFPFQSFADLEVYFGEFKLLYDKR